MGLREVIAELDVKVRGAGSVRAANAELDRYVASLAPADARIEDLRVRQAEAAEMASRLGQRLRGLQTAEGDNAREIDQLRRAQFRAQDAARAHGEEIRRLEQEERDAAAAARKLAEDTARLPDEVARLAREEEGGAAATGSWTDRLREWVNPQRLAVAGMAAMAAMAITVGHAARAAAEELGELIDEGHELSVLADRLNVSARELQRWQFIGDQTGLRAEALTSSFGALARNAEAAVHGAGPAVRDFRRLGVTLRDANGHVRDQADLFRDTIRALAGVEDRTRRSAIAQRIFSEGGTQLLALIDEGPEAIDRLSARFDELGGGLSDDVVAGAEEAHDSIGEFHVILQSLRSRLAAAVLPTLNRFLRWASDFAAQASMVVGRSSTMWILMRTAAPFVAELVRQVTMLGAVLWAMVAPLLRGFLVLEDFVTALRGGRSRIGEFVEQLLRAHGITMTFGGVIDQAGLAWTRFQVRASTAIATLLAGLSAIPGASAVLAPLASSWADRAASAAEELATGERIAEAREAGRIFSRRVAADPSIAIRNREAAEAARSTTHNVTYNITGSDPEAIGREVDARERRRLREAADTLPLAAAGAS